MQSLFVTHGIRRLAQMACLLSLSGAYAFAGIITFAGEDLNAGPGGPFTNSNAAEASFATAAGAIGNVGTITFASAPLGAFTSLTVAPGVTASGPSGLSINNVPNFPSDPSLDGFSITPGGQYVEDEAGTLTFTFASPVQFFGTYLTGLQIYFAQDTITFNDGTSETIDALEAGTGSSVGAVNFLGFTDAGKSISSITITSNTGGAGIDYIGVDNVMYQTTVPEPASIGLVLTALLGLFLVYRAKLVKRV
jgi:hypothetical protein